MEPGKVGPHGRAPECIVVLDDFPPYFGTSNAELDRLRSYGNVVVHDVPPRDREQMFERMSPATALINVRIGSILDAEALSRAPRLRMISFVGVGPNNIDLKAASGQGITVCNLPGENAVAVAEFALGLMLAVMRRIVVCENHLIAGRWEKRQGQELFGKTLGIVGLGAVGAHLCRIGKALGMETLGWSFTEDPKRAEQLGLQLVDLDDVFRQADIICLCVRGSTESTRMVDERRISLMKPSGVLINTARGAVVDQQALAAALREGRLSGAGLDVFEREPLTVEANPFLGMEGVVITPHMAGETVEATQRMQRQAVKNVIAFFEGSPVNIVR